MEGLENTTYLVGYIVSNFLGMLILLAAIKKPKLSRLMLVFLFGWASWINYSTANNTPNVYLEYANMSFKWYSDFINGWFKDHITTMVTLISAAQALIAVGMILKGWWVRMSCIGVIVFLTCIAPLGVGSAFPFSITVSLAAFFILKKDDLNYLWKFG